MPHFSIRQALILVIIGAGLFALTFAYATLPMVASLPSSHPMVFLGFCGFSVSMVIFTMGTVSLGNRLELWFDRRAYLKRIARVNTKQVSMARVNRRNPT